MMAHPWFSHYPLRPTKLYDSILNVFWGSFTRSRIASFEFQHASIWKKQSGFSRGNCPRKETLITVKGSMTSKLPRGTIQPAWQILVFTLKICFRIPLIGISLT